MSTRAIVKISDEKETYCFWCPGDGDPDGIGKLVAEFVNLAPRIDSRNPKYEGQAFRIDYEPNEELIDVSFSPKEFAHHFIRHLHKRGYTYAEPIDVEKEKGEDLNLAEWLYDIRLNVLKDITLEITKPRYMKVPTDEEVAEDVANALVGVSDPEKPTSNADKVFKISEWFGISVNKVFFIADKLVADGKLAKDLVGNYYEVT